MLIMGADGKIKTAGWELFRTSPLGVYGKGTISMGLCRTAALTASTGGSTTIGWDTVLWDTAGLYQGGTQSNVFVAAPGWYIVVGYVNSDEYVQYLGQLNINNLEGGGIVLSRTRTYQNAGNGTVQNGIQITALAYLADTHDGFKLAWDSNGKALSLRTGAVGNGLAFWRVG